MMRKFLFLLLASLLFIVPCLSAQTVTLSTWTVTVTGNGFVQGSSVNLNGSPCPVTVFISATQLTAQCSGFGTITVTNPIVAPTITTQPGNATVQAGETATFTVVADGAGPLSYQWLENQKMIGENLPSYTTPATVATDDGSKFQVVVTNAGGLAESDVATLTVTAPPPPPPLTTENFGETTVLSGSDNGNANRLIAQSVTFKDSGLLASLSFYVAKAAGNLMLGVYDATGPKNGPGKRIVVTPAFAPVAGWNLVSFSSPVAVTAGPYWLAYLPSDNNLAFVKGVTPGVNSVYYATPFGAFPTTFATSTSASASHWSFYATLNVAGTVVPPPPPPATHSVLLSWTLPASGTVVSGINIYRSMSATGSFSKLNDTLVAGTSFMDATVQNGQAYFYNVKSFASTCGCESIPSDTVSVTVPAN